MAGRDWTQEPFQQTIPSGAGPTDPRIEIGQTMPADLVAKYATVTETIIGGIVFYKGTTPSYFYLILTVSAGLSTRLCLGGKTENTLVISEYFNLQIFSTGGFLGTWSRFATTLNSFFATDMYNSNVQFRGIAAGGTFSPSLRFKETTKLIFEDQSEMDFNGTSQLVRFGNAPGSGNQFLIGSGAFVVAQSGGSVNVQSGGFLTLDLGASFTFEGFAQPGGFRVRVVSLANSAAVGAEAVVLTTAAMNFQPGRAYRIRWAGTLVASVAQTETIRVRKTNVAGQIIDTWTKIVVAGALTDTVVYETYVRNNAAGVVNGALCLTLQASAGTLTQNGGATNQRFLEVEDCGSSADYSPATVIV